MKIPDIVKVLTINSATVGFSFTEVETLFRMAIIFVSIIYTIVKLMKEINKKNE